MEFLEDLSTSLTDLAAKELAILEDLKVSPVLIMQRIYYLIASALLIFCLKLRKERKEMVLSEWTTCSITLKSLKKKSSM